LSSIKQDPARAVRSSRLCWILAQIASEMPELDQTDASSNMMKISQTRLDQSRPTPQQLNFTESNRSVGEIML